MRRKKVTPEEIEMVKVIFLNDRNNSTPQIAKRTGLSFGQIDKIIDDMIANKELLNKPYKNKAM